MSNQEKAILSFSENGIKQCLENMSSHALI